MKRLLIIVVIFLYHYVFAVCLDPNDPNCFTNSGVPPTNTYTPPVINTNLPYQWCINSNGTIMDKVYNTTPGHTYWMFVFTNAIIYPTPTKTNEYHWFFYINFNGSSSPISIGGIPAINNFYQGLIFYPIDVTSPPHSLFITKPELSLLTGRTKLLRKPNWLPAPIITK